jgi:hypothetical protein
MRLLMSVLVVITVSSCKKPLERITEPPMDGCLPIKGTFNPSAPAFIVEYKSGVDPVVTTAALGAKYSFSPIHVYTALPGFAAELSTQAVKGVSCEPSVAVIEHDGLAGFASTLKH